MPLTDSPKAKPDALEQPRQLTPSEIASLRQDMKESSAWVRQELQCRRTQRKALSELFLSPVADCPHYRLCCIDGTLLEIARRRPRTFDEFTAISGIGTSNLNHYGQSFLNIVLAFS